MTGARVDAIAAGAELVKSPDWSETRHWLVVSGDLTLAVVEPAYTARGQRGWSYFLTEATSGASRKYPTRTQAGVAALAAWKRFKTRSKGR